MSRDSAFIVMQGQTVFVMLLVIAVMISGMSVAYVKFESRKLFGELEKIRIQRDELVVNWGRLQIELATWAEHGRIEVKASDELDMLMPKAAETMVIKP